MAKTEEIYKTLQVFFRIELSYDFFVKIRTKILYKNAKQSHISGIKPNVKFFSEKVCFFNAKLIKLKKGKILPKLLLKFMFH